MKVFGLVFDHQRYQMVGEMRGFLEKYQPTHAGSRLLEDWEPMTGVLDNPTKRRGDFLLYGLEYFVCKHELTERLAKCVRGDVQVLPVQLQGEAVPYDLWNITTYIDALDTQKTQYKPPPFRSIPQQWVFKSHCFDRATLFRTPQLPTRPLAVTGMSGSSDKDFYLRYQELKLKGIKFELLWEAV